MVTMPVLGKLAFDISDELYNSPLQLALKIHHARLEFLLSRRQRVLVSIVEYELDVSALGAAARQHIQENLLQARQPVEVAFARGAARLLASLLEIHEVYIAVPNLTLN